MNSGNELPTNPYSGGPLPDASPKPAGGRWRTVLYVLHIVLTVAIMFVAPQTAKIVSIAVWLLAWAVFNTWKKDVPALAGGWTSFSTFVITVLASWISSGTIKSSLRRIIGACKAALVRLSAACMTITSRTVHTLNRSLTQLLNFLTEMTQTC